MSRDLCKKSKNLQINLFQLKLLRTSRLMQAREQSPLLWVAKLCGGALEDRPAETSWLKQQERLDKRCSKEFGIKRNQLGLPITLAPVPLKDLTPHPGAMRDILHDLALKIQLNNRFKPAPTARCLTRLKDLKGPRVAVKMDLIKDPKGVLSRLAHPLVMGKETIQTAITIDPTNPETTESKGSKENPERQKTPSTQSPNRHVETMIFNPVRMLTWVLKVASTLLGTSPVTPLNECQTQR
jgi:hypothetical protein